MSLLKPASEVEGFFGPPLPPGIDAEGEYEVENILAHRKTKGGKYKYLVKWKGYTFEESTWEPESNFKSHVLRDYKAKLKKDKEDESASEDDEETLMAVGPAGSDMTQDVMGPRTIQTAAAMQDCMHACASARSTGAMTAVCAPTHDLGRVNEHTKLP